MCGISGLINKNGSPVDEQHIQRMTDLVSHRGPDDHGYFMERNFAFGHRRLSILDLTPHGHQPFMCGEDNRFVLIFNGEIYNYIELKKELENYGYTFRTKTDSEVIPMAYDHWGEACVEHFNGMWAFALYDKKSQTIFCSRDRFGIKPFYYVDLGSFFAFGSEIKQFTGLPGWHASLNLSVAIDFLNYGILDHTEYTFFKDVRQLRGGCNLVFDLKTNRYRVEQWYDLSTRYVPFDGTFEDAVNQFRSLFDDAVSKRLRADVKVGSCLSGGLDSSSIVCEVNQQLGRLGKHDIQETVSACFKEKEVDEQPFIDAVIDTTNVNAHKVFPDLNRLMEEIDKILWHQDEPFGSSSILAQWEVFSTAHSNNITVMLDGQGADEVMGGYHNYYEPFFRGLITKARIFKAYNEYRIYERMHGYGNVDFKRLFIRCLIPDILYRQLKFRRLKPWHPGFLTPAIESRFRELTGFIPYESRSIRGKSLNQTISTSLPALLHYEDRDSMAFSIESRVPFLDYRLVEFLLGLEDSFKINEGTTKYILRQSMQNILPEKIYKRTDKLGFSTPESRWILENHSYFRQLLSESLNKLSGIIDKEKTLFTFDQKGREGNIRIRSIFWRAFIVGKWMEIFSVDTGNLISK